MLLSMKCRLGQTGLRILSLSFALDISIVSSHLLLIPRAISAALIACIIYVRILLFNCLSHSRSCPYIVYRSLRRRARDVPARNIVRALAR